MWPTGTVAASELRCHVANWNCCGRDPLPCGQLELLRRPSSVAMWPTEIVAAFDLRCHLVNQDSVFVRLYVRTIVEHCLV